MKNYALIGARSGDASYRDFLKLQAAEDHISSVDSFRFDVSTKLADLISTQEQLGSQNIQVLNDVNAGIRELQCEINRSSAEINATLNWGFTSVIAELGNIYQNLDELINIAKTPAQTWAFNQFEIARDAFRQKLYPEALEHLDRAINGTGDNPGYALEYRFHYLKGLIRLGSIDGFDEHIVDLREAEEAFVKAGRYAATDYPKEAARALCSAGWATYCQGELGRSREYTEKAVQYNPKLGEGYFQLAKISLTEGNVNKGIPLLQTAIENERGYALKACGDDNFLRFEDALESLFNRMTVQASKQARDLIGKAENEIKKMNEWKTENNAKKETTMARSLFERAANSFNTNTYYGYVDVCEQANAAISAVYAAIQTEKAALRQRRDDGLMEAKAVYNEPYSSQKGTRLYKQTVSSLEDTEASLSNGETYAGLNKDISAVQEVLSNIEEIKRKRKDGYFTIWSWVEGLFFSLVAAMLWSGLYTGIIDPIFSGRAWSKETSDAILGIGVIIALILGGIAGADDGRRR